MVSQSQTLRLADRRQYLGSTRMGFACPDHIPNKADVIQIDRQVLRINSETGTGMSDLACPIWHVRFGMPDLVVEDLIRDLS